MYLLKTIFREIFRTARGGAGKNMNKPPPCTNPKGYRTEVPGNPPPGRESVQLKHLVQSKYFVLIDDTPSMQTWWSQTQEALIGVIKRLSSNDEWDGFNVRFIHHTQADPHIKTEEEFESLFNSVTTWQGEKVMAAKVAQVFKESLPLIVETSIPRPIVFLIITDGIATDTEELSDAMTRLCQKLNGRRIDPHMFRIHILQMGNDRKAIKPLNDFCDRVTQRDRNRQILDVLSFHRGRGLLDSRLVLKFILTSTQIPDDEDPELGERQPAEAIATQYATLERIREMGTRMR